MEVRDFIQLLQYYQHDIKNELQLVHGYLSMNQPDRAKNIVDHWIKVFHQEQHLFVINAPLFALWLFNFNYKYESIRLSYQFYTKRDLYNIDRQLVKLGHLIVKALHKIPIKDYEILNLTLKLTDCGEDQVELEVVIKDRIWQDKIYFENIPNLKVQVIEDQIHCSARFNL